MAKNRNENKEWSLMDRIDLSQCLEQRMPIKEIAHFLMRREDEIVAKIKDFGLEQPLQKRQG